MLLKRDFLHCLSPELENFWGGGGGERKKEKKARRAAAVAEGHTVDTKASSERPAAEAACTGRPGPLKDWESDSFPRGFPTSLHFRKIFSFSCYFTPCKEFSSSQRNCFIIKDSCP